MDDLALDAPLAGERAERLRGLAAFLFADGDAVLAGSGLRLETLEISWVEYRVPRLPEGSAASLAALSDLPTLAREWLRAARVRVTVRVGRNPDGEAKASVFTASGYGLRPAWRRMRHWIKRKTRRWVGRFSARFRI